MTKIKITFSEQTQLLKSERRMIRFMITFIPGISKYFRQRANRMPVGIRLSGIRQIKISNRFDKLGRDQGYQAETSRYDKWQLVID
jgi:hypothetical protein